MKVGGEDFDVWVAMRFTLLLAFVTGLAIDFGWFSPDEDEQ